jgi:hypothetical protein
MSAPLAGTGRLADDLYLMAHHETSGKPYLQPRALGICLAAGLLAELVLAERIDLKQTTVVVIGRTTPDNALAEDVLRRIQNEPVWHPVPDWLLFLAQTAAEDVAFRLERAAYLVRSGTRIPGRAHRWTPKDSGIALTATIRACSALDASRPLTIHCSVLAGLAGAAGLTFRLSEHALYRTTRRLDDVIAQLHPVLAELIRQTQAAVDSAVLSHRA